MVMADTDKTLRKLLEDKLYKNEDLFRAIAAYTPDHIIVQDNDLRYTYVINPQLGLTEQDMIGKTDYDFLSKEDAENLTRIKRRVIDTGKQVKCETYLTSIDGKKEFFDGVYIPRFDLDSKVAGLIGYFRNRTEHKLIENTLVESEKSLNAAQSLAQIGSWQWTMATDTIKWSEELCLINGHDPRLPPPVFAEMSSFYTPESWARLIEVVTKALNSGESYELFLDLVRTDGNIRKTLSRGLADYDVIGKITGLHGTVQDITERKLVEEKLESEHSILTALINSTGDTIIFTLDRRYCYTAFNEKHREEMKRIWNAEIKTGMNLLDCMQIPELRESAKQSIDRALTGEVLSEIQHQPEHNIYYELNWNPIWQNKEIVGVTALIKDITKKKQAEEALKVNEALFREYYDNMKSGSAIFTVINDGSKGSDYIIKKINRVGLKMEGKELEEVVGKKFNDIRPAIDSYGLIPVMKKVWETGESAIFQTKLYSDERYSNYYENYVFKLPSGEVVTLYDDVTESKKAEKALQETKKHLEIRVQERTADLEQVNRVLQVQIAERKAAEDTVNFERQRLYDVLETLPVYVILLSADYHVPFANRFFLDRFGESEGRRCYEYLFHRDSPCEICETYTVLKTSAPHKWEWIGPDGRSYDIFDFLFTDRDGSPLVLEMGVDITERKQAEETLQKAHNNLEQRVAERTEELSRVNKQLQKDITERKLLENKAKEKISEIERFNNLMIGREFRMIELKKEINEFLVRLGEKKKYRIPK